MEVVLVTVEAFHQQSVDKGDWNLKQMHYIIISSSCSVIFVGGMKFEGQS